MRPVVDADHVDGIHDIVDEVQAGVRVKLAVDQLATDQPNLMACFSFNCLLRIFFTLVSP